MKLKSGFFAGIHWQRQNRAISSALRAIGLSLGVALMLFAVPGAGRAAAENLTPIKIQLKWFHQYQFAGYYAAEEQGYFRAAGLAVELIEGGPSIDPVQQVVSGAADFGVGNSSLVLDYLNGEPVVMVSAIFQHSPFVILARKEAGLERVQDLEQRTLMGETHAAELLVYLLKAGVDLEQINLVEHTGNMASLQPGAQPEIHATTAYVSTEPFQAIKADLPYQIFSPRDYDIDFYGDTLFTARDIAKNQPELVKAVRDAVAKGWQYALQNPESVVQTILSNYPTQKNRLALTFEAQSINPLLNHDLVEVGYISRSRLNHIATLFSESGLTTFNRDLRPLVFETTEKTPAWVGYSLLGLFLISVTAVTLAVRFHQLNQQRLDEINQRKQLEAKLNEQARTDALTGLANRRRFEEAGHRAFIQATRHSRPLAIVLIDVDQFKAINDQYGHHLGDLCLQAVSNACNNSIRAGDLAARLGGDEFVLLLPDATAESAEVIKERLPGELAANPVRYAKQGPITFSLSIGIGWRQEGDTGFNECLQRADQQMYLEKQR